MDFKEYQEKAEDTDQSPIGKDDKEALKSEIIPLLGLVGESGVLLSEYKKKLRDGEDYTGFKDNIKEELGDLLWYISNLATKFDLNLNDIAKDNVKKIQERWKLPKNKKQLCDESLPPKQQFPRKFSYKVCNELNNGNKIKIKDLINNKDIGDALTDNSYDDDGYRYHDIMHMTFMTHFGWSPVFRKLMRHDNLKIIEKRNNKQDEVEDGGRAQIIEEAIIHAVYIYAEQHKFCTNISTVDLKLLKFIKNITSILEIKNRTLIEWQQAIISGCQIWKKLIDNHGGVIEGNLNDRTITYKVP